MPEKIEIIARQEPWNNDVQLRFIKHEGRKRFFATLITFEEPEEGSYIEPSAALSSEEAQSLFNQLWAIGFRPKDGTGNSGHIAAVSYHLEDMRRLVFGDRGAK